MEVIMMSTEPKESKVINLGIIGCGNCASSLIQGIYYYKNVKGDDPPVNGVMHNDICGYTISSIRPRLVIDVDARKVGKKINEAIFAKPNCTKIFCRDIPDTDVVVKMGYVEDGVSPHMLEYPDKDRTFVLSDEEPVNLREELIKAEIDVVVILLPTGSQKAVERYVEDIIAAGCGLVNGIPVFVASNESLAEKFRRAGLPVIGDDVKSQFGSTVLHRVVAWLMSIRGMKIIHSKQLNWGGNTDFLNLLNFLRVIFKKISKTEAVESVLSERLSYDNLVIEPAFYVPHQNDNKQALITFEANQFGDVPMSLEMKLSVEDSPNSAGILTVAIRGCKVAKDRGLSGPIVPVCAHLMKHPPVQMEESLARKELERFIADSSRNIWISPSREKKEAQSGDYWSEYWTQEAEDAALKAKERNMHFEVWAPEAGYHLNEESVCLIEKAADQMESYGNGYEKNIYVQLGATKKEHKERTIKALNRPGINVWAINTQPDKDYLEGIPNIRGCIAVDDFALGQKLFDDVVSSTDVSKIAVFVHEDNGALRQRIEGIKNRAQSSGMEVLVCETKDQLRVAISDGMAGGIGLGIRGSEEFIKLDIPKESFLPIVSVDANKRVLEAMADKGSNKRIIAVYTQKGLGENLFCGHTYHINPVRITA
jgi:myo-inositol-1-phosphate synthase